MKTRILVLVVAAISTGCITTATNYWEVVGAAPDDGLQRFTMRSVDDRTWNLLACRETGEEGRACESIGLLSRDRPLQTQRSTYGRTLYVTPQSSSQRCPSRFLGSVTQENRNFAAEWIRFQYPSNDACDAYQELRVRRFQLIRRLP